MEHYDVIIIGAGLGGLACGKILADRGLHVAVLERCARPGGCLQSYRRQGLELDTGFHYVGGLAPGEPLHDGFERLGLLSLPWQRMDPVFDRITIAGRTFGIAQGRQRFIDTLAKDFPAERRALVQAADMMQGDIPISLMEQGAWGYLNTLFHDPLLIDVISGASMRLELRKESLPMFTFLHCMAAYVYSSWRLKGSGQLIADTLAESVRRRGGDVICQAEAVHIDISDNRAETVHCSDGRQFSARWFISDLHPALTLALFEPTKHLRPVFRRRITCTPNTTGMMTVSLILREGALPYFNYNHYIYPEGNIWEMATKADGRVHGVMVSCRIPEDGTAFARQVDLLTPMTWAQCEPWAGTAVGHRGDDYEQMKHQRASQCIRLAETVIPGLGDMVEQMYVSTPLTYQSYTHTPEGSAFGLRKDYRHALTSVFSPRTPIPNLLLTGQSLQVHGLEGVTQTAFTTTNLLRP